MAKVLIPEHATRQGESIYACRASEVVVLEIYDSDGNPVDEAVSIIDPELKFIKGQTTVAKPVDSSHSGDVEGISFSLSRAEANRYCERKEEDTDEDSLAGSEKENNEN